MRQPAPRPDGVRSSPGRVRARQNNACARHSARRHDPSSVTCSPNGRCRLPHRGEGSRTRPQGPEGATRHLCVGDRYLTVANGSRRSHGSTLGSQQHNGLTQIGLSCHRWTERSCPGALFVRSKIVDPSGSMSLSRFWAGGEPDILRRLQAYSRYRVLRIPPVLRRPFDDK